MSHRMKYSTAMKDILRLVLMIGALLSCTQLMAAEYAELSDHFAVKPAALGGKFQELFVREKIDERFKLIGTTMPTNWNKPFSGAALEALQASVMAISDDGKTLLYWHQDQKRLFGSTKAEGIYRYRIGEGDRLLYPESQLKRFWWRYDKPLPKQIMAIRGSACTIEELCALSADDGSLTPLAMVGSSPLHAAAYSNDLESARTALKQAGGIDTENYWGFTALEIAIKKGHDEISLLLLRHGADFRHKQKGYLSPLQMAVYLHRWQVLEALGSSISDPALLYYAFGGTFSNFMADDTKNVRQDDLPRLVHMMLNAGLDPAKVTAPVVFWLLDKEKLRGSKAQLDTLKLLLDHGARVDQPEPDSLETPLQLVTGGKWSLADGAREVSNLLIPRMGSLDARNKLGLTALQLAMLMPERGDGFDKALHLIKSGADDSVEYLCGVMMTRSRISIRQKLAEWHGVLPKSYDCGAYR